MVAQVFSVLCHVNAIIIQYEPIKCVFQINILMFIFWCLLHGSNPRVNLQEDGCICICGMVCVFEYTSATH